MSETENEKTAFRRRDTFKLGVAAILGGQLPAAGSACGTESKTTPLATGNQGVKSIREFGISPERDGEINRRRLQEAIDHASTSGDVLFVEPSERPYPIASGLTLRANVSLLGVHGPVGRGTRHPKAAHPVGSVLAVVDDRRPFLRVESSTQLRGLQFWYPEQTLRDPARIVPFPPTIQVAQDKAVFGVTLSCLSFFGEFHTFDFASPAPNICEQLLFEHCYGYPLSGRFINIDRCYDIPRVLHCHVNPSIRRLVDDDYPKEIVDTAVARGTFTYDIDHTDNAQLLDVFTFGVFGGIRLGPATYGQLTQFNLDCVTVGIHKSGDSTFNRNWQIAQGSIIANAGTDVSKVHPVILDGRGHTSLVNVESFSGGNRALTNTAASHDFLLAQGDRRPTASLVGCRMRNYTAAHPISVQNPHADIHLVSCLDRHERFLPDGPVQAAQG
jgi:hypothetical protein